MGTLLLEVGSFSSIGCSYLESKVCLLSRITMINCQLVIHRSISGKVVIECSLLGLETSVNRAPPSGERCSVYLYLFLESFSVGQYLSFESLLLFMQLSVDFILPLLVLSTVLVKFLKNN